MWVPAFIPGRGWLSLGSSIAKGRQSSQIAERFTPDAHKGSLRFIRDKIEVDHPDLEMTGASAASTRPVVVASWGASPSTASCGASASAGS
jgi:hypothetical protein